MKKITIIGVVILVVVIAVFGYIVFNNVDVSHSSSGSASMKL